jgi:hypothetical protein
MTDAFCFRCEWHGRTWRGSCPRCGATLSAAARQGQEPRDPRRTRGLWVEPQSPARAPRPSRRVAGIAGMAAVAIGLGFLWARVPGVDEARPASAAGRTGTLIYASDSGAAGGQRLWKLDLSTGSIERGPKVPQVEEIVNASYPGIGWIGITSSGPDGDRRAYVLDGTAPGDRADLLGSGDLVAWGPSGQHVVIARRGRLMAGCRRHVTIQLITVESREVERTFRRRDLCGDLVSVGRDTVATYFTRVSRDRLGIFYAGIGVAHSVLPDYALVSVSSTSDMLVTGSEEAEGTVLYWRGRGGPVPLGTEAEDLVVARVLAWSPDGGQALVAGRLGDRTGLFGIVAGPGEEPREPTFVRGASGPSGAAFSDEGVAYLALSGGLFEYREGRLKLIDLPAGAPRPLGPVAWVA